MPLYVVTENPTPSDTKDSPVTSAVEVEEQVVVEATIFMDSGVADEVRAGLFTGDRRIFPHPNGDPARVPGRTGPARMLEMLPGVPNDVTLRAWTVDADNDHDVVAHIETRAPENVADDVRVVGVGEAVAGGVRPARRLTNSTG